MKATIAYLAHDPIYELERGYEVDYLSAELGGLKRTNHKFDKHSVIIHNIDDPTHWDLNVHGFCVLNAKTRLNPYDAISKRAEVEKAYWYEIEAILHEKFPEYSRIESYDCTIRIRDEDFPGVRTLYNPNHEQPSTIPHTDYSARGSYTTLEHSFPGQDDFWNNKDFDLINVWRPLFGPNDDWPLVMCDWTTVNPTTDILVNDALRRDRIDENSLMHYNPSHKWYYLKQQTPDDLFVFRNCDSFGRRARCFHTAVYNPESNSPPRSSVEVRLVAFR